MTKKLVLILLFLISLFSYTEDRDNLIVINQSLINKLLSAIGEVRGSGEWNVLAIKGNYNWKISNARVEVDEGGGRFLANAALESWVFNYSAPINGKVDFKYDFESDSIKFRIYDAFFEIYLDLLGNKVHVSTIDISKFYPLEFSFPAPMPEKREYTIKLPDKSEKKIGLKLVDRKLRTEKEKIVLESQFEFIDNKE